MSESLRILFVEPPQARRTGGPETALRGLAHALREQGLDVARRETLAASDLAAADVVHFHCLWERTYLAARRLCAASGKPFIVSPHGMLEPWAFRHKGWKKWPYFHLFERRSIAQADVILATSELEADQLRRWFPPEQIRVIPLGGEPAPQLDHAQSRQQLGCTPNERVVLFLSRCHEKKGLHLLIRALPEAAGRLSERVHLLVVGDGDSRYLAPLRTATETWREPLRCTWVGPRWGEEKWTYLHAADLFCLPSFSENFGLAVLEALQAGTRVLTTTGTPWATLRGGLPVDVIEPTQAALVDALRRTFARPRADAAERAATRSLAAQLFSWPVLAPRYAALYREIARA